MTHSGEHCIGSDIRMMCGGGTLALGIFHGCIFGDRGRCGVVGACPYSIFGRGLLLLELFTPNASELSQPLMLLGLPMLVKIEDPKTGFYIIVGSTTSESEALEKAKTLHWMALNFPEIGRFRLATDHFATRNEALEALDKVRLDVDSEAWILKH